MSLVLVLVAIAILVSASWHESAAQTGKGGGAAAVYQKHCAKCHGADGKGIESLKPPDFTSEKWQKENTTAAIAKGIREGKGVMPGFKDTLTAAQITALVKHTRAFGPKPAKPAKK
ncbi:MAG: c-type cytochrome [Blastocatellia bacterium]